MPPTPVEIQWCDHSSVLLEYLRQLYEEGRFVDVGLECEGRQVKAHKAVISACSPYLEGLLKGNPARSHLIKFNGYSYASLRAVIDFMYHGKVLIDQENLAAFLKLGRALQVRGILDIAAQCEEAGLTTPDETKSNAQYSTNPQQQKLASAQLKQQQQAESKKYAFLMDKHTTGTKKPNSTTRKGQGTIIGSVDQTSAITKTSNVQSLPQTQQVLQQVVQPQQQEAAAYSIEELQQALASGQALIQTDSNGSEQTLQMVEGQCVVTPSGQTYVVVQEGENLSFVPAEMVQGDLQSVNGGQVIETLDNVEEQLAQMEGQVLADSSQAMEAVTTQAQSTAGQDSGSLDTMSVVESLVKLGQKQPTAEEQPEIGPDMPCLDADMSNTSQVGPDMPDLLPTDAPVEGEQREDKQGKTGVKRKLGTPDDWWETLQEPTISQKKSLGAL